jgi:hypothetical protein
MRRKLTIETILITGLTITFGLLLTAALLFYNNHKKLLELREQLDVSVTGKQGEKLTEGLAQSGFAAFLKEKEVSSSAAIDDLQNTARQNSYIKYARRDNGYFLIFCCIALITIELAAFNLIFIRREKLASSFEEPQFGPPGFFYPLKIKGAIKFFEGKVPQKPPRRHFTNLILDIKQINLHEKSYIKVAQKLISPFRSK